MSDPNAPKRTGSLLNLDFESEKFGALGIQSDNESATMASEDIMSPYTTEDEEEQDENATAVDHTSKHNTDGDVNKGPKDASQQQKGLVETKSEYESDEGNSAASLEETKHDYPSKKNNPNNPYGDEDTFFVRIPVPGLPFGGSCLLDPTRLHRHEDDGNREMRLAPGLCTICLSNYKVGTGFRRFD